MTSLETKTIDQALQDNNRSIERLEDYGFYLQALSIMKSNSEIVKFLELVKALRQTGGNLS